MIYPWMGDSLWKHGIIPHEVIYVGYIIKGATASSEDESAVH